METGEKLPLLPVTSKPSPTSKSFPDSVNATRLKQIVTTASKDNAPKLATQAPQKAGPIKKTTRTRKAVSAFRKKGREYRAWRGRVGVHLEVDSIDLKLLSETNFPNLKGWDIVDHYDVIHLKQITTTELAPFGIEEALKYDTDGGQSEDEREDFESVFLDAITPVIFIFSFGPVVFWNFPDSDAELKWLKEHLFCHEEEICGDRLGKEEIENASDEIEFVYGMNEFKIRQDVVHLATRDPGEKMAVSFAFAKSSLLSMYELQVQCQIEENSSIPEELAKTGRVYMKMTEISKGIGQIFLLKHGINLDSNLQDTPEEFWQDERFEENYTKTLSHFSQSQLHMHLGTRNKIREEQLFWKSKVDCKSVEPLIQKLPPPK